MDVGRMANEKTYVSETGEMKKKKKRIQRTLIQLMYSIGGEKLET